MTDRGNRGDRVQLVPNDPVIAGTWGTWCIVYTAGGGGIAVDGGLEISFHRNLLPLFRLEGDWTSPQVVDPTAAGYTTATTTGQGRLDLDIVSGSGPALPDGSLPPVRSVRLMIKEAPLLPGEQVTVTFGDTSGNGPGTCVQHLAQREMEFTILVDYVGEKKWIRIADSPYLDILGGSATRLRVDVPSIVRSGEEFHVSVQPLDAFGHPATGYTSPLTISNGNSTNLLPGRSGWQPNRICLRNPGVQRITVLGGELKAESNPIRITDEAPTFELYWGDIHGHSNRSDGLRSPDDYFSYARDVSRLDFAVLTDHEPGFGPQQQQREFRRVEVQAEFWAESCRKANSYHEPGRFVTFNGYEWTSGRYGHKCVYYLDNDQPLFPVQDERSDSPDKLYQLLTGRRAMVITHHPAGGPVGADLSLIDPAWEPLVEIYSCHGCSDAPQIGRKLWRFDRNGRGFYVQDALDQGYRFGIIAGSDTHTSDPGNPLLNHPLYPHPYRVGLMAVYARELTREALWEAMWARRVYATTGEKILLQFEINGHGMGEEIDLLEPPQIKIRVSGTAPLLKVEMIHNGRVTWFREKHGLDLDVVWEEEKVSEGYYYLRITQEDGEMAWSSPIWVRQVKE